MDYQELVSKFERLPVLAQQEVLKFLDGLVQKYSSQEVKNGAFSFDWEGGLADLKGVFTSVQLQHKITELR